MAFTLDRVSDLSERDVEHIMRGVQPPGRDDLAPVVELTAWMHASRELEPAPTMNEVLSRQVEAGVGGAPRSSRRAPAHLSQTHRAVVRGWARRGWASAGRPAASVAAAAALLVGAILTVRGAGQDEDSSVVASQTAPGPPVSEPAEPTSSTTPASEQTTSSAPGQDPSAAPSTEPESEASPPDTAAATTPTSPPSTTGAHGSPPAAAGAAAPVPADKQAPSDRADDDAADREGAGGSAENRRRPDGSGQDRPGGRHSDGRLWWSSSWWASALGLDSSSEVRMAPGEAGCGAARGDRGGCGQDDRDGD